MFDFISTSSSDRMKYNTLQRLYIQHRERTSTCQSSMWAVGQLIQAKQNLITLGIKLNMSAIFTTMLDSI